MRVILASSSTYRRELLERLRLEFEHYSPEIDESSLPGEPPTQLVARLAREKARAVAARAYPRSPGIRPADAGAVVIGSDQMSVLDGRALGKPGGFDQNVEQLMNASGRTVEFLTALCVLHAPAVDEADAAPVNPESEVPPATPNQGIGEQVSGVLPWERTVVVPFEVTFRALTRAEVERYVQLERAYDCAGGFRCEGLGIALFERMRGDDPTSLIGLPLIELSSMLRELGVDPLRGA